jgi:hypothetical protein
MSSTQDKIRVIDVKKACMGISDGIGRRLPKMMKILYTNNEEFNILSLTRPIPRGQELEKIAVLGIYTQCNPQAFIHMCNPRLPAS